MVSYLLQMLILSLAINIAGFLIAFKLKTDKLTDFSYAFSFVVLNGLALFINKNYGWAHIIMFAMISLWALRLGSYLVIRIHKWGRDKRFDQMRCDFKKFLSFWLIQAFTVWIVSICSLLFMRSPSQYVSTLSLIGFLIFLGALGLEASADIQKFKFISNAKNKGKFISTGLWAKNRHPNYLGEIFVWLGVYVFACSSFDKSSEALIAIISPLFIFLMIRFVSGIPILEKQADDKWGKQKAYQDYKKQSGLLLFKLK